MMRRFLAVSVALAAALGASLGQASATQTATLPHSGLIGFSDPNGDFAVVHPDGSGLRVVAKGMGSGVFSPSGQRVAFTKWVDTKQAMAIYVLRMAPAAVPHQVGGYTRYWALNLSWRPTGSYLLYADDRVDADPSIGALKLLAANGSGVKTLAGYRDLNMHPAWSHDARRIAWTRVLGGDPNGGGTPEADIWTMRSDGTHMHRLTHNHVLDENPVFSASGRWIAYVHFESALPNTGSGIWLMRSDGTGKHAITNAAGAVDLFPAYSPAGSWIAFVRYDNQMTHSSVMLVHPNGSGLHMVAKDADKVSFSPDGRYLLIGASSSQSISITPTAGGPITHLADGWGADWQPIP